MMSFAGIVSGNDSIWLYPKSSLTNEIICKTDDGNTTKLLCDKLRSVKDIKS